MADHNNFLDDKDVVYFHLNENEIETYNINPTMTVEEIKNRIQKWSKAFFKNTNFVQLLPYIFRSCAVLRQDGKGWKKGKIILKIEFIPDQPEPEEKTETSTPKPENNLLDDFRN